MKVYQAPVIQEINSFYGTLLYPQSSDTIFTYLTKLSVKMEEGLKQKVSCIYNQLSNYHPDYLGIKKSILSAKEFNLQDCQHALAKEYGFVSWKEVKKLDKIHFNLEFENCINTLLKGEITSLKRSIQSNPELLNLRSQFGHKATLLHYTASNGFELWRQQVPQNLMEIIKFLIDEGADKQATMNVYKGRFTAYELYVSSTHPYDAGIDQSTAEILRI